MKLLFSEARPDYGHYIFPYAIWAFPEPGETPADFFVRGFLPSSRDLDRFYLCRQVRVDLRRFAPSSENRRVLRKGGTIRFELVPRTGFDYTPARREFCKTYADARFGQDVMSYDRLDGLFSSRITTHLLVFTESGSGREVGVVTLYLEPGVLGYYYYAFYDLAYLSRNLGIHMMTAAAAHFSTQRLPFLYLGSCYVASALYKTQFAGAEFFNGVRWSDNLDELKYLIRRDETEQAGHLLESAEYRAEYYGEELPKIADGSLFTVNLA